MSTVQNNFPFLRRFFIYQKERFPLLMQGTVIAIFTFSAISYSRICRGAEGFIAWSDYLIGVFATITLFFLVRVFDEFKDQKEDAEFRPYLPVPRGLISLKELGIMGWIIGAAQVAVIAIFQLEMLYLYAIVLGYLLLMRVEFFVPKWLKRHQLIYITSHMAIIPLIDLYASGLDWLVAGGLPHWGLAWFFAVSYMNGLVLEFGRKIRTPETEEPGVVSYTGLYGTKKAVVIWLALLLVTMGLAMGAAWYAGFGGWSIGVFEFCFAACSLPAWLFLAKPTAKRAKAIEYASAIWTALMYLALGGVPMLKTLFL